MVLTAVYDSSGKPIQGTYTYGPDWQEEFQSWLAVCRPDYFGVTYLKKLKSDQDHIFCNLAHFYPSSCTQTSHVLHRLLGIRPFKVPPVCHICFRVASRSVAQPTVPLTQRHSLSSIHSLIP